MFRVIHTEAPHMSTNQLINTHHMPCKDPIPKLPMGPPGVLLHCGTRVAYEPSATEEAAMTFGAAEPPAAETGSDIASSIEQHQISSLLELMQLNQVPVYHACGTLQLLSDELYTYICIVAGHAFYC